VGLVWQRGYHDRVIRRGDLRRPESGSGGTLPTIRSSGSEGDRRGIIVSCLVCRGRTQVAQFASTLEVTEGRSSAA